MSLVNLPLYKGFDTFAIWPCQQTVSLILGILLPDSIKLFQVSSCYGLFSINPIMSPVSTGNSVTLPFYPGYKYVAYQSKNVKEVWILRK